jgi:enediyne polyketide synthase
MNNRTEIAIVGLACVYPDARTPGELWENALAQRRAFRRLPPERLRLEDYWSPDPAAADRTYTAQAAVIEGYEFDRVSFRVAGSTFRSADLAHWLALDVAAKALADAGFPEGRGLPRETTGILVGNSLTGEFSRANLMRLRWPYVRRVLAHALAREGWDAAARQAFLAGLESEYKAPFPEIGEESLAGGLSNTIAGRICNHFDLKGGGYTVDGACASSLLAVANACSSLVAGDLDVALAGGVDLSLDPFEMVGFAKTGALAREEMRVFDRRSAGFWPGEGCGFVVLMRHADALAQGARVYAVIRGWGISSDGSGGLTRPEADGQLEALRRAYRRAGFGAETVAYCEAHGTGTAVGDATELQVLTHARDRIRPAGPRAAVGAIKANIGHTKAASGVAGLIKATMAVHTQVLPPTTGCDDPQPLLQGADAALRVVREAELWPADLPLRACVSAMGFGGINAHVVLESPAAERRRALAPRERTLTRSFQDAELFLFAASNAESLRRQVRRISAFAARLSRCELSDLAAQLAKTVERGRFRAAVVAGQAQELGERLETLESWLAEEPLPEARLDGGVFFGRRTRAPRLAFLFPGQGSPTHLDGGLWARRFERVAELYRTAEVPHDGDPISTRIMQPAIVTASLAGLRVLADLGLEADAALGHSLGEFTALHWAGTLSEESLLRLARVRGAAMAELGAPTGAMLAVAAGWQEVSGLLAGEGSLAIVGYNSPRQTVVAGEASALRGLGRAARDRGWRATQLPVSHAFHTPLVSAAVPVLADQLAREHFAPLEGVVVSSVTGVPLHRHQDLRDLLCRQVTSPVRFSSALDTLVGGEVRAGLSTGQRSSRAERSKAGYDLLVEVGPGAVLTGLAGDAAAVPALALDAGGPSLAGLLRVAGAAFALGAPLRQAALFADRFTRPFSLDWKPKFLANPCEAAPVAETDGTISTITVREASEGEPAGERVSCQGSPRETAPSMQDAAERPPEAPVTPPGSPLETVRQLVAERAELPLASVQDASRMLSDLHLNSITVGQLVSEAAKRLALPRLVGLTDFANASVAEIAKALEELKQAARTAHHADQKRQPPGVDIWLESFVVELIPAPAPRIKPARGPRVQGHWEVFAPARHPWAEELKARLPQVTRQGVALVLPENPGPHEIDSLLAAAHAVLKIVREPRFLLVQHGWGGSGLARTLHLETPGLTTTVVNVPPNHPQAVDWIVREALTAKGYREVFYDAGGARREPRLKRLEEEFSPGPTATADPSPLPVGPEDLLLVTGGAKGIAAECALALSRATGAGLVLLGRSDPAHDRHLQENLERIQAVASRCRYVRADVTDAQAVKNALRESEGALGRITGLIHGAGVNTPQLISGLREAAFRQTVSPKIDGARNVLAALDTGRLRLFVTFGSIIARAGLRGEADYATANEWLTELTERFQREHPHCRCLALEWSVWSGVGMGERLGRVDALIQQGIMPIPPDEGVRIFLDRLRHRSPAVAQVIAGRFGETETLRLLEPEWPMRRFLERRRVFYPGVELVVDAELSRTSDPYLDDHIVQKQRLLPAVVGLEAMAQAAMALAGSLETPSFEGVVLSRPVLVAEQGQTTVRLAALRRGPDLVEVCLRSEETDFHVDHFRALCRFGPANDAGEPGTRRLALEGADGRGALALDPGGDLYGGILFHQGRFQRVRQYRLLKARECIAELTADGNLPWFGPYYPGQFVLGDPGARDAALHAVQGCIPHRRILPTGIDRLVILQQERGPRIVTARERAREGNSFTFDLEVTNAAGQVVERWDGLRLRAVEELNAEGAWPRALLAPYLERRLEELVPNVNVGVGFERVTQPGALEEPAEPRAAQSQTDWIINRAIGGPMRVWRRPDGKPVTLGSQGISAAHAGDFILAVAGDGGVACDLEPVSGRAETVWRELLPPERRTLAERVAAEAQEPLDTAATRVWTAIECLKKAGLPAEAPLVLDASAPDGWVLLRAGHVMIATWVAPVRGSDAPLALGLAVAASPLGGSRARAAEVIL